MLFVVFGASGRLGRCVVEELKKRGLPCRAVVRDPAKANWGEGVEVHQADLTQAESLPAAIAGATHVIMAAGGFSPLGLFQRHQHPRLVDGEGVMSLVRAVKEVEGCKLIISSSLFVTRPNTFTAFMINTISGGAMRWKAVSDQYCREAGIEYCIVRPSHLVESVKSAQNLVIAQGDEVGGEVTRPDVAFILVEAALSDKCTGCTIDVTSSDKRLTERCSEPSRDPAVLFAWIAKD